MKQRKSWPLRVVSQLLLLCLQVTTALVGSQPGGTAQPGTVDQLPDPLTMSRISMGLQSADNRELHLLSRCHTRQDFVLLLIPFLLDFYR